MERRRESVSWGSVIIFVRMDDPEIACLVTCTLATQAGVPRGSMVMRLCRVNIFGSRFLLDCRFCRFRDYEMNEPSSAFFLLIFVSCRFSSGTEDRGIESGFFVPLE